MSARSASSSLRRPTKYGGSMRQPRWTPGRWTGHGLPQLLGVQHLIRHGHTPVLPAPDPAAPAYGNGLSLIHRNRSPPATDAPDPDEYHPIGSADRPLIVFTAR